MNETKTKEIFEKMAKRESKGVWFGLDRQNKTVDLSGKFTLDEIKAILWFMENIKE